MLLNLLAADPVVTERLQRLEVDFLKAHLLAPASPASPHFTTR